MKRHREKAAIGKVTFAEKDLPDIEYRVRALYALFERVKQRRGDETKTEGRLLESAYIKETRLRIDREWEYLFEIDRRLDRIEYNLKWVIQLLAGEQQKIAAVLSLVVAEERHEREK